MDHKLYSSPLQGFTDFRFRNAFQKYFGGIDTFYAPYIRLNGKLDVKPAYERDILPKNNSTLSIIPQIMTNSAEEFLFVADYVQKMGYNELNWNLGCPYPMVTKRGMGSGLICESQKIDEILNQVHNESNIIVSMKMRLGFDSNKEILNTLPILNKYPLKNIGIHARLGKQLYKGGVDLDGFDACIKQTDHLLYYNGDITTVDIFNERVERFPKIKHWMIGRGLIKDPFLPAMIKSNASIYPNNKFEIFRKFHDTLFSEYEHALSGPKHIIMKMYHFWEYFSITFVNSNKALKKIKKSKTIQQYEAAVAHIFADEILK